MFLVEFKFPWHPHGCLGSEMDKSWNVKAKNLHLFGQIRWKRWMTTLTTLIKPDTRHALFKNKTPFLLHFLGSYILPFITNICLKNNAYISFEVCRLELHKVWTKPRGKKCFCGVSQAESNKSLHRNLEVLTTSLRWKPGK